MSAPYDRQFVAQVAVILLLECVEYHLLRRSWRRFKSDTR